MPRWLPALTVCLPRHLTESALTRKGAHTEPYSRFTFSSFWYVRPNTEVLGYVLETS
jgi:hypothetical protein